MIIATHKNFELDLVIRPSVSNLISLELFQRWPEADRPHWRRITQLNLTRDEIQYLVTALQGALE